MSAQFQLLLVDSSNGYLLFCSTLLIKVGDTTFFLDIFHFRQNEIEKPYKPKPFVLQNMRFKVESLKRRKSLLFSKNIT